MVTRRNRGSARQQLDARLSAFGPPAMYLVPRLGWMRAVRDALGMSAADLGARLSVSAQSVLALEASEVSGTARLDTLRRAADAMGCTLVYAMIPNSSLQSMVEERAAQVLDEVSAGVQHSMALEDQAAPLRDGERRKAIDSLIDRPRLWSAAR